MEKKKREIKVVSIEEALKRMQAFLYANMMDDHDLELENSKDEKSKYYIKLIWLAREAGDKNKVGCPCFACSYKGVLPFSDKVLEAIAINRPTSKAMFSLLPGIGEKKTETFWKPFTDMVNEFTTYGE